MSTVDEQITALTQEYYSLISGDHHKDRDCHFTVEKWWSYGEAPHYRVQHQGYVNEWDVPNKFSDSASAHRALLHFLTKIVKAEREWANDPENVG